MRGLTVGPAVRKRGGMVQDVQAGHVPYGAINPRDYRFVMSLARRYNAIVFWQRDRNGIDWQPVLMPLSPRAEDRPASR